MEVCLTPGTAGVSTLENPFFRKPRAEFIFNKVAQPYVSHRMREVLQHFA